ncbi:MerR family transcriptional regulator [Ralstonia pickettii]|uniref:MerR family transcriptional regulator n=1 Tax=Ralstonia pickettii TaxID=329 RepID=A0A2N4TLS8_RALPI|nr:MerR family transcriptional regulator [Ralstonia pickettii]PLC40631.1 MerR family transcriptional regulator [Ralstonia pickettii]
MKRLYKSLARGHYRSGEAAKLARMSASTLRIWERKYAVVVPPKSASGQRLYSEEDIERLRLIRELVDCGHAIRAVASLNVESLKALVQSSGTDHGTQAEPISLLMVGPMSTAISHAVSKGMNVCGHPGSLEEAFRDAQAGLRVDALLAAVPSLTEEVVLHIAAVADAVHARAISVIFTSGTPRAIERAGLGGLRVVSQSEADTKPESLVAELVDWATALRQVDILNADTRSRAARRFDDKALSAFAGLTSTIQCECPRHLAELVIQLSAFQRYSDACLSRSPRDALLHRRLGNVANRAVQLLETALAEVVRHEGLLNGGPS